jgi:hypothetical protein
MAAIEAAYLPQIARLFRRKHAADVSVLFPALNGFGRVCALVFALHEGQTVFVAGFVVGIALRVVLLSQVIWYRFAKAALVARRRSSLDAMEGV